MAAAAKRRQRQALLSSGLVAGRKAKMETPGGMMPGDDVYGKRNLARAYELAREL